MGLSGTKWLKGLLACGALVLIVATLLVSVQVTRKQGRVAYSLPSTQTPVRHAVKDRTYYPYSVIPGGIRSTTELRLALAEDRAAAAHYRGFDIAHARVSTVTKAKAVFVSYRVGDRIYWTRNRVQLHKGETILDDGVHQVRGRCGNRIDDSVQTSHGSQEPDEMSMDTPVDTPGFDSNEWQAETASALKPAATADSPVDHSSNNFSTFGPSFAPGSASSAGPGTNPGTGPGGGQLGSGSGSPAINQPGSPDKKSNVLIFENSLGIGPVPVGANLAGSPLFVSLVQISLGQGFYPGFTTILTAGPFIPPPSSPPSHPGFLNPEFGLIMPEPSFPLPASLAMSESQFPSTEQTFPGGNLSSHSSGTAPAQTPPMDLSTVSKTQVPEPNTVWETCGGAFLVIASTMMLRRKNSPGLRALHQKE